MSPNVLFPFMRKLAASKEVVDLDVVEYSPYMDNRGHQTARLVNKIMVQYLTAIAMKRKGLDPDYIHPLVADPPNNSD